MLDCYSEIGNANCQMFFYFHAVIRLKNLSANNGISIAPTSCKHWCSLLLVNS